MQRISRSDQVRVAAFAALLAFSGAAFAAPAQSHHCKMADGSTDMQKTKKQCVAAKGKWTKDADAAKSAPKAASK